MTIFTRHLRRATVLFAALLLSAPAFAVSKEMVQLQTQVQQLQDAVAPSAAVERRTHGRDEGSRAAERRLRQQDVCHGGYRRSQLADAE